MRVRIAMSPTEEEASGDPLSRALMRPPMAAVRHWLPTGQEPLAVPVQLTAIQETAYLPRKIILLLRMSTIPGRGHPRADLIHLHTRLGLPQLHQILIQQGT